MNFLTGRLATDAKAGLRLEGKGASVSLAGVEPPAGVADQELTLGVRPDDLRLSEPGEGALTRPLTLTMEVSSVARHGGHCPVARGRVDVRLTARPERDGA